MPFIQPQQPSGRMMGLADRHLPATGPPARDPPGEAIERRRFMVDGHVLVAVPAEGGDGGDFPTLPEPGEHGPIVGGLTCSGTRYFVYEEDAAAAADPLPSMAEILTRRELQVAMLISDGRCDKEIARQLGISGYTVREHIRRIFAKLKIGRRSALVAFILRSQLQPTS